MLCIQCNKEFKGLRSTARFCSGACKLNFNRGKVSVSSLSVSLKEDLSVSDPRKLLLSKKQIEELGTEDRELYQRYLDEIYSFVPSWIRRKLEST